MPEDKQPNKTFDLEATVNKCTLGETSTKKPKWVLDTDKGKFHVMQDRCQERPVEGARYMIRGSILLVGEKGNEMKWASEIIPCSTEDHGDIPGITSAPPVVPAAVPAPVSTDPSQKVLSRDESYQLHVAVGQALNISFGQCASNTPLPELFERVATIYPQIFEYCKKTHKNEEEKYMAGF